jgi:hypothetical protein
LFGTTVVLLDVHLDVRLIHYVVLGVDFFPGIIISKEALNPKKV